MKRIEYVGWKHAALECRDLARSLRFYQSCFGMEPYLVSDKDWAMLVLGDSYLSLVPVPELTPAGKRAGSHPGHLGLLLVDPESVHALHEKLRSEGINVGKILAHRDGSQGFYLSDPDGNALECIFVPHRSHSQKSEGRVWVLLCHGSSDADWAKPFERIAEQLRQHVPSIPCELAFMGSQEPSLESVVAKHPGVSQVDVFPVFLSGGGAHSKRDIPELVSLAAKRFTAVQFQLHAALGENPLVQQAFTAAIVRQGFPGQPK
ncbi:VOC family protein [bacterium]|nr:VOC family protein [bacterium]